MKYFVLFCLIVLVSAMTVKAASEEPEIAVPEGVAQLEAKAGGPVGIPCILHTDCILGCNQLCSFYDNPTCLYNRCWCRV